MDYSPIVERWCAFEVALQSVEAFANPFLEVWLEATFQKEGKRKKVSGFYDGGSSWKVRFMPEEEGIYSFRLSSNLEAFNGLTGTFACTGAQEGNHGPVRVNGMHFNYADGTPFFAMGTTAYAWTYRPEAVRRQTLESFSRHGFNKIRMLVFPKYYRGGDNDVNVSYDPPVFPFAGASNAFDFQTLLPAYFQNFEERVKDLMKLGIEADVILFHPYDRWGIDRGMRQEDDVRYVKYLISRLAAYRNVWWSLANEYDIDETEDGKFCVGTDRKQWDLLGAYIYANDPYRHPISNHNFPLGYIYPDRHWLTHVSYQHPDTYTLMIELKNAYRKPVINDEYQYEGNIRDEWGNSDAQTTVLRHWLSALAGGYASHGEVFKTEGNDQDLFWSYGGILVGDSGSRLKFMKQIIESCPFQEMKRDPKNTDGHHYFALHKGIDEYLFFCRYDLPGKSFWFGPYDGSEPEYEAEIYDVWNCVAKEKKIVRKGSLLPISAWTAIRLKRIIG
ncbi:DUF5060 domain-containing protein [Cohnella sp. F6_2S_P_1]|uniref:DUF5060 domain-containing protein n=2 Tax=Cohnella hashimotonis TaxID=2826895 RepID=A0ABT6TKK4_9BACL|nr:DUF5060 domain-containing protein [Cohnella hashimotonis]MDI4646362.1 DUF5060 domain-containing protein [Cohnella hashimotonis]